MSNYIKTAVSGFAMFALTAFSACGGGSSDEPSGPDKPDVPSVPTVDAASDVVIYEANPLFFAQDKCFDAIGKRLDAIDGLGTDVLWLMPIYTQGQKNAIGSPYCVKDYKGINPKYGDMASLKSLVSSAHAKGMKVILDWVANHTAWDNAWITEHPDWYLQQNGQIVPPPGTGWNDVAELNYENTALRAAMIDAMLYWIREADVDGFRCDYAEGVPADFWREATAAVRKAKPEAFLLAEASDFNMYDNGFDMIYDWAYCTDLQDFYHGKISFDKVVEKAEARASAIPADKNIMRYAVNHDVISEKSPSELYGSNQALIGAYVLTAFLGQVPMVYSGMEAGFDRRTAFINAKPLTWNASLLAEYQAIDKAYKATAEARGGKTQVFSTGSKAVAYTKTNGSKTVLVAVNPTGEPQQVKVPMALMGLTMSDLISGQQVKPSAAVTLPAYGYLIYAK